MYAAMYQFSLPSRNGSSLLNQCTVSTWQIPSQKPSKRRYRHIVYTDLVVRSVRTSENNIQPIARGHSLESRPCSNVSPILTTQMR